MANQLTGCVASFWVLTALVGADLCANHPKTMLATLITALCGWHKTRRGSSLCLEPRVMSLSHVSLSGFTATRLSSNPSDGHALMGERRRHGMGPRGGGMTTMNRADNKEFRVMGNASVEGVHSWSSCGCFKIRGPGPPSGLYSERE